MKTIAKYIPVEGEIKVGDHYDHYGTLCKSISRAQAEYQNKHGFKKVKFFAVTRDIKIGEEVTNGVLTGILKNQMDQIWVDCGDRRRISKGFYKILGEISPSAIWVKKGEECEIEECITVEISPNGTEKRYYKVKCPTCETYH